MPGIAAVSVFPSVKFLSTNAKGDLSEVIAQSAVASQLEIEGVLIAEAVTPGVAGDSITIAISFSGNNGDPITYSATGNNIAITLPPSADGSTKTPITLASHFEANAPSAITDLITLKVKGGILSSTNVWSGNNINATNLAGGADESTVSDLEKSSKYLCIKVDDLHGLEASEEADGRKLIWGILHQASTIFEGLATQPDSLKIAKSVPSSADQGTTLKQVYTITSKYGIENLDLKAES